MRTLPLLAISLVSLLSACGTPDSGYYDANGNWIAYNRYNQEAHEHPPLPGGTQNPRDDNSYPAPYATTTVTTYSYDRPGYYDRNGYYIAMNGGVKAPEDMLPPPGMCRVWFPHRDLDSQPDVESCSNIKSHVPAGAYVIYGG